VVFQRIRLRSYLYIPTCTMYSECFRYNGLLWERETIYTQSSQWAPVLWSKTSKILFGPVNSNFHFKDWYKCMALQWTNSNKDYGENSVWFPERCDYSGSLELWCLTPLSTILFQLETRDPSNSFRCVLYSPFSVETIQNFEFLQW
jgi:hypothetical protein